MLNYLGLFRFWNAVYYFYPYHAYLDETWEVAFRKSITHFLQIRNSADYLQAVKILAAKTQDAHTVVWQEEPSEQTVQQDIILAEEPYDDVATEYTFPFEMSVVEDKLIVGRIIDTFLCQQHHILLGDVITGVDGKTFNQWKETLEPVLAYSRTEHLASSVAYGFNSWVSDTLEFTIKKKDSVLNVTLSKIEIPKAVYDSISHPVKWQIIGDVGYVNIFYLSKREEKKAFKQLKKCKGIILDLRGYPEDDFSHDFLYRLTITFKDATELAFPYKINDKVEKVVAGVFQSLGKVRYYKFFPKSILYRKYRGKIVALIDEQVISAAETYCMAIKANRKDILFIGRTTAAANGSVSPLFLPGGIVIHFAVVAANYPNGRQFQRIGIIPDIILKTTLNGIRAGKDEVLEKALNYIQTQLNNIPNE